MTETYSTSNMDMVKSLGADSVIDYTSLETRFDIIFGAVGKTENGRGSLLRLNDEGQVDTLFFSEFTRRNAFNTVYWFKVMAR